MSDKELPPLTEVKRQSWHESRQVIWMQKCLVLSYRYWNTYEQSHFFFLLLSMPFDVDPRGGETLISFSVCCGRVSCTRPHLHGSFRMCVCVCRCSRFLFQHPVTDPSKLIFFFFFLFSTKRSELKKKVRRWTASIKKCISRFFLFIFCASYSIPSVSYPNPSYCL